MAWMEHGLQVSHFRQWRLELLSALRIMGDGHHSLEALPWQRTPDHLNAQGTIRKNFGNPAWQFSFNYQKPWQNGFASRRKFFTRFVWPPTCADLRWLWSNSNSYASRRKFSPFGRPTQVDSKSSVYAWNVRPLTTCMRDIASRLANPFGHPSQVLVL